MKKKILRVLSAIIFALALVVSTAPDTAMAAEVHAHESVDLCRSGDIIINCTHVRSDEGPSTIVTQGNSLYHVITIARVEYCATCDKYFHFTINEYTEDHDMSGVASSPYRYSCVICGYKE